MPTFCPACKGSRGVQPHKYYNTLAPDKKPSDSRRAFQSLPEPARACQSLPEPARACQSLPEPARALQSLPKPARACPSLPEPARACQSLPEPARACQSLPEPARACQSLPEPARPCQTLPEPARACQSLPDLPEPARACQKKSLPKPARACHSLPEPRGCQSLPKCQTLPEFARASCHGLPGLAAPLPGLPRPRAWLARACQSCARAGRGLPETPDLFRGVTAFLRIRLPISQSKAPFQSLSRLPRASRPPKPFEGFLQGVFLPEVLFRPLARSTRQFFLNFLYF